MLGDKLRELRKQHKKTQAELGHLLGTDQSGYSKIENGVHSLPVSLVCTIANYYKITTDELFDFKPENSRSELEKACEKLDKYGIEYIKSENDYVEIPIINDCVFRISTKKLPILVNKLESKSEESLNEMKIQAFRAFFLDYLQNNTNNN